MNRDAIILRTLDVVYAGPGTAFGSEIIGVPLLRDGGVLKRVSVKAVWGIASVDLQGVRATLAMFYTGTGNKVGITIDPYIIIPGAGTPGLQQLMANDQCDWVGRLPLHAPSDAGSYNVVVTCETPAGAQIGDAIQISYCLQFENV